MSGSEPQKTRVENHFLLVSVDAPNDAVDAPSDVAVIGIEVFTYTTEQLTTVFVSKADSTGFLTVQRISPTRTIATTFLDWLCKRERHIRPSRTLMVSLFARSQSQYLFPGSAENPKKHVLDDRQLIKWWARVLDPIFTSRSAAQVSNEDPDSGRSAFITVPGYEGQAELRQFIPPSGKSTGPTPLWKAGDPLLDLGRRRGLPDDAPARCLLPRFPDDPKARFMQDLDDEVGIVDGATKLASPSKRKVGHWKSIKSLDRFWEGMEFRQECSSGRLVGFLWLIIDSHDHAGPRINSNHENLRTSDQHATDSTKPSVKNVQRSDGQGTVHTVLPIRKRRRKILTGPIVPRKPRLKGGSSTLSGQGAGDVRGVFDGAGGLILDKEGYDKALQTLLHLDFANRGVAVLSTKKWVAEVSNMCGLSSEWSQVVVGSAKPDRLESKSTSSVINDLGSMIRKKRKIDEDTADVNQSSSTVNVDAGSTQVATINVLGSNLVRKKSKPLVEDTSASSLDAQVTTAT